jgi:hypothetical protein
MHRITKASEVHVHWTGICLDVAVEFRNYFSLAMPNSVASVRGQIIPTERLPLIGEVGATFFADRRCQRNVDVQWTGG